MEIKLKLENGAKAPVMKTEGSACYDCYAYLNKKTWILPFQTKVIPLGIRTEFEKGFYLEVRGRSGNAVKGIQIIHGTVDSDYRGIIGAITHNNSIIPKIIKPGDRIAQFLMQKIIESKITIVDDLSETVRGEGGFGSTGK